MKRISNTQIMSTPTLRGEDAEKLIESLKFKQTEKSKENARKLVDYFRKFESK